jgi:hypothetical protein
VAKQGRSSADTAAIIGTNRGKVEKARAIHDHAAPETKAAVLARDRAAAGRGRPPRTVPPRLASRRRRTILKVSALGRPGVESRLAGKLIRHT